MDECLRGVNIIRIRICVPGEGQGGARSKGLGQVCQVAIRDIPEHRLNSLCSYQRRKKREERKKRKERKETGCQKMEAHIQSSCLLPFDFGANIYSNRKKGSKRMEVKKERLLNNLAFYIPTFQIQIRNIPS